MPPNAPQTRTLALPILGMALAAALACILPLAQPPGSPAPPPATSTSPVAPTFTPTPVATSTPIPEHRIAIRDVDGAGEFYDRVTGESFVPRGMNYNKIKRGH